MNMNPKSTRFSSISPVLPPSLDVFASNYNRSVFVRDLPFCCTTEELRSLFRHEAGIELEDAVICRNNEGKTLQYGCVMFYDEEDVDKVIDKLNGFRYHGRDIRIIKYNKDAMMESSSTGAVLVSFKGTTQDLELITEATIRAAFEKFGEISHVSIRSHLYNSYGIQGGFGFLGFVDSSVNNRVVAEINQTVLGGVQYDCNWSKHMNKNGPGSEGNGYSADGNSFFKRKNNHSNNSNTITSQKENSSRYGPLEQQSNQQHSQQQQAHPPQYMHYLYSTPGNGPYLPTFQINGNAPPSAFPPMYANQMTIPMSPAVVGSNMNMGMMIPGQNGGYYVSSPPGIVQTEPMPINSVSYAPSHIPQPYQIHSMPINLHPSNYVPQQQHPSPYSDVEPQKLSSHIGGASGDGQGTGMPPVTSASTSTLPSPQSQQIPSHLPQNPHVSASVSNSPSAIANQTTVQFHQKPSFQPISQPKHTQAPRTNQYSHQPQHQNGSFSSNASSTRTSKVANNPPSVSVKPDIASQQSQQPNRHQGVNCNPTQPIYPSSSSPQQQASSYQQSQSAASNLQGNYSNNFHSTSVNASPHVSPMMPSPAQSQPPQNIHQPHDRASSHPSPYQSSFTSPQASVSNSSAHLLPNAYSPPHVIHTPPHIAQPSPPQQQSQHATSFSVPIVPPPLPAAMGYMPSPQLTPMQPHMQIPQNHPSISISYPSHAPSQGIQYNHAQQAQVIPPSLMQQQVPQQGHFAVMDASAHNGNMMVYQAQYPTLNVPMYNPPQNAGNFIMHQPNAHGKVHMPANNTMNNNGYYSQTQN